MNFSLIAKNSAITIAALLVIGLIHPPAVGFFTMALVVILVNAILTKDVENCVRLIATMATVTLLFAAAMVAALVVLAILGV